MIGKPLMTLAAVAMLGITTGCAAPGLSAAPDVHRFLVSARDNGPASRMLKGFSASGIEDAAAFWTIRPRS